MESIYFRYFLSIFLVKRVHLEMAFFINGDLIREVLGIQYRHHTHAQH